MALPTQKITTNAKTLVTTSGSSLLLANNHASSDVTVDLYITNQIDDKTTTGVRVNLSAGYGPSRGASQQVIVDTVTATNDMFLNERVYDANGIFIGTATTVGSTLLTFSGGIVASLSDDDFLFTGTRYYILNNVVIPNGSSLKLEPGDWVFDDEEYKLYILSNSSDGNIDLIAT